MILKRNLAKCNLCNINEYVFLIKKFKYWDLCVGNYQHTLGSLVIVLKKHKELFSDLNKNDIIEMLSIVKTGQKILTKKFNPDWFNVQQNGNWEHHLHIHITPRYKKHRRFDGRIFNDKSFGQPVQYTNKSEKIKYLNKLTDILKENL